MARDLYSYNAPDQKRAYMCALNVALAPVFCIWLLCGLRELMARLVAPVP